MKLITRDTDYAVRALCCIAKEKKEIVSAKQLVKCLKVPRPFFRKLLQTLNKKGVLRSQKGKGGGFALALPAGRISLIDLMEIFQGSVKLNEHLLEKKICPNIKTCPLKRKIDAIEKYVISELKSITIASLIKEGKTGTWRKGR